MELRTAEECAWSRKALAECEEYLARLDQYCRDQGMSDADIALARQPMESFVAGIADDIAECERRLAEAE